MAGSDLNPHASYRELRETDPVHWNSKLNVWTLTRYADISAALLHPDLSSERKRPRFSEGDEDLRRNSTEVYETIASWLLRCDPPAHTRLRRISAPALRSCIAARARERIEQTTDKLLGRSAAWGGMDVISDLARPLSLDTIATIVGVPAVDHHQFCEWADSVGAAAEGSLDAALMASARRSLAAADEYLRQMLARRREHPEHDLMSGLVGDLHAGHLNENEIVGTSMLLLLAGHETLTHLIGNGVLALLQHRDQIEQLQLSPDLWPTAVHELLRYASPLQGVLRTATADLSLGGAAIRKGDSVFLCLAAGNHDPEVFPNPEQFDVSREPNPHLALGRGFITAWARHSVNWSVGLLSSA